jgi:hypothetical protein
MPFFVLAVSGAKPPSTILAVNRSGRIARFIQRRNSLTGVCQAARFRVFALFQHRFTSYAGFYAHFRAVGYTKIVRPGRVPSLIQAFSFAPRRTGRLRFRI